MDLASHATQREFISAGAAAGPRPIIPWTFAVYSGTFWYILVSSGIFWYILVYAGISY
jgi:hypothetical protein